MAVNATVNTPRTVSADLTQSNTSQVVRVTVPGSSSIGSFAQDRDQEVTRISVPGQAGPQGPAGPSGADGTGNAINTSTDIDNSSLAHGSLLQYSTVSSKWTAVNDISNLGSITINGGNF